MQRILSTGAVVSRKYQIFEIKFRLIFINFFRLTLCKTPKFHLFSWYGNFAERCSFCIVSGESREILRKLCVSTKFSHQEITWNYGNLCSDANLWFVDGYRTRKKNSVFKKRDGVFSGPYFPAFGLNTKRYEVSLRIQSRCGKIRTRKNSVFEHFSRSVNFIIMLLDTSNLYQFLHKKLCRLCRSHKKPEATVHQLSVKKLFKKMLQPTALSKKKLQHRYFPLKNF